MMPTLQWRGLQLPTYALFVALAFALGFLVRRAEARRLGFDRDPRQRYVALGALRGAVVGAKLGMLLFEPVVDFAQTLSRIFSLDFTGKTVVGGLAGGYIGVEIAKKIVGITRSTGDAFAIALPIGQAIGRVGCFFNGCCYGTPTELPLGVLMLGAHRHPTQLYEAALDLALAGLLFATRHTPKPAGHLFRRYLVGYALIRFTLEGWRGDPSVHLGPLSLVQLLCLAVALIFGALILRGERRLAPSS